MDLAETNTVKPGDARPFGRPDECFYCRAPMGAEHAVGCVIVSKSVVVEVTIQVVQRVPRDWTAEQVEFSLNESSSCADNILSDVGRWAAIERDGCSCGAVEGRFLRDATPKDHEHLPVLIDLPAD